MRFLSCVLFCLFFFFALAVAKLKERECEVCIKVLNELNGHGKTVPELDTQLRTYCKSMKNTVEGRFCYYLGAAADSAASIIQEALRPLSFGKPAEKICEDLKSKDSTVCTLRFEKPIDLTGDLRKFKMADLRKAIAQNKLDCSKCTEKADYVSLLENFRDTQAGKSAEL